MVVLQFVSSLASDRTILAQTLNFPYSYPIMYLDLVS